jgi:signal transduction histidine kinase
MLDFAQMRSGKFRKDVCNFNIKEAINEIINVQKLKADFCAIDLSFLMKNFPLKKSTGGISKTIPKDSDTDYVICSDTQRVQQVLLNLQSNALKFTPTGGQVLITCTLIKAITDLKH